MENTNLLSCISNYTGYGSGECLCIFVILWDIFKYSFMGSTSKKREIYLLLREIIQLSFISRDNKVVNIAIKLQEQN